MAEIVTKIKIEIDASDVDAAVERYALVSRADVQRMIAEALRLQEARRLRHVRV